MEEGADSAEVRPVCLMVVSDNGNGQKRVGKEAEPTCFSRVVFPLGVKMQFSPSAIPQPIRCWTGLDPSDPCQKGDLVVPPEGSGVLAFSSEVSVNVGDEFWRQGIRLMPADIQAAKASGVQFIE